MVAVYRDQILTSSDLNWYITTPFGNPVDVHEIFYKIEDYTDLNNIVEKVAFTSALSNKFSTGSYFASWVVPTDENIGTHRITWKWKLTSTSPEQQNSEEFEVLSSIGSPGNDLYILPEDLYFEGLNRARYESDYLEFVIKFCQSYLENITDNFFIPKQKTFRLDGKDGNEIGVGCEFIELRYPIIDISEINYKISNNPEQWEQQDIKEFEVYDIYDKENIKFPKIAISKFQIDKNIFNRRTSNYLFPVGRKNIEIKGRFGWVEEDLTTPPMIKRIMVLLCLKWSNKLATRRAFDELRQNHKRSETTDGHKYIMHPQMSTGKLTGDPIIDSLLRYYMRSPSIGVT